ncbi:MAG: endonuclease/exonuclease/phosphatase family protein [Candidatus Paceibacterota bacterium]|jgi:endonuclease/exonuclease/phosphatase family metal-dependent hydrolase
MEKANINKTKILKIAHYNIFNGGTKRLSKIAKVIKEIDPDICGLLECVGWENDVEKYKKYFKSKGYAFFYFIKANSKYNISVISKIELKVTAIRSGIRHAIIKAEIVDTRYASLNIFYIHLSPKSEKDRLGEVSILLKKISKQENTIIMGDFNSLSRQDNYKEEKLLKNFKKNGITKYGEDYLNFDVISKIEKNKFIDIYRYFNNKFRHTAPTKSNTDINHKERVRIDYAFTNKEILKRIRGSKIHKSKLAEIASDHYPLYVEIKKQQ